MASSIGAAIAASTLLSIHFTREGVLKVSKEQRDRLIEQYVSIRFTREGVLKVERSSIFEMAIEVSIRFTREGVLKAFKHGGISWMNGVSIRFTREGVLKAKNKYKKQK